MLRYGVIQVGALAGESIKRLAAMLGGPVGEVTDLLTAVPAGAGPNAGLQHDLTDGGFAAGDFVIVARRYLAEIDARCPAATGHVTYEVQYLAERAAGAGDRDEWPAEFVSPFISGEAVIAEVRRQAADIGAEAERVLDDIDGLRSAARDHLRELWRNGLRDVTLSRA